MFSQDNKYLKDKINKLPTSSGVYKFLSKTGEILYIGKATNLKDRVKSYFSSDLFESRGPKILKMLELANDIDFEKTDSVLEALLLENFLIKKYSPLYNTKEKDDKSFQFVVITKEDFPRVLLVRGRDILVSKLNKEKLGFDIKESFGPFPSGSSIKEALKIIRKIFPFRDKCIPCQDNVLKAKKCEPCFNRQIGLCPGVCSGEISEKDYGKNIKNIIRFFEGKKTEIVKDLNLDMKNLAKLKEFEKANIVKKQIFSIKHIQDVSLLKEKRFNNINNFRIESYDIAHTSGKDVVGVIVVLTDGQLDKNEYRKFNIKNNPDNNDLKSLKEILERRLSHRDWSMPDLIVVDGGLSQKRVFERLINDFKLKIPVVSVVKDNRHRAREILGDKKYLKFEKEILLSNEEAHRFAINWHRKKRGKLVD